MLSEPRFGIVGLVLGLGVFVCTLQSGSM
jgi:hypothetical protein